MPTNEKEYNGYLLDQLSAVERIERQALKGDMEAVKEEIEILKKEINRKLYQKPPLITEQVLYLSYRIFIIVAIQAIIWKAGDYMGMTDSQFNGFVRFVLDDIEEVLENMSDGKEKDKLQKAAYDLQQTLGDQ